MEYDMCSWIWILLLVSMFKKLLLILLPVFGDELVKNLIDVFSMHLKL